MIMILIQKIKFELQLIIFCQLAEQQRLRHNGICLHLIRLYILQAVEFQVV